MFLLPPWCAHGVHRFHALVCLPSVLLPGICVESDVTGGQVVGGIAAPHAVLSVAEWRANRDGPGNVYH